MSDTPLRRGQPVWLGGETAKQRYASLKGRGECDVVIVGGGITGALTALAFAEAGVPVSVLEGALVGRGSTAASSALLLHEPDQGMGELAGRYGTAAATRIWRLSRDAVGDLVGTIRRLRLDCDLSKTDTVYYAANADAARSLRTELRLRTKAGFGGEWVTPGVIRRLTGIASPGAIRTSGNATFNPYRACVGLTAAGASAGARIFERSMVTRIVPMRDRVRVYTARGSLDASTVIIATGYATQHFRPLAGRFRMYHTYVVATEPLTASERREIGLGDVMVWDTRRPYHYARWTRDHRLLLGGSDRPVRPGQRRNRRFADATHELRGYFDALLPGLTAAGTSTAWEGLFALTPDSLPYIGSHQRYPRHLFALGYGGNGMTFGFLAARFLLEQWQGIQSSDHRLFRFSRLR